MRSGQPRGAMWHAGLAPHSGASWHHDTGPPVRPPGGHAGFSSLLDPHATLLGVRVPTRRSPTRGPGLVDTRRARSPGTTPQRFAAVGRIVGSGHLHMLDAAGNVLRRPYSTSAMSGKSAASMRWLIPAPLPSQPASARARDRQHRGDGEAPPGRRASPSRQPGCGRRGLKVLNSAPSPGAGCPRHLPQSSRQPR